METTVSFICRQRIRTRLGSTPSPIFRSGSDRIDLTALGALAFLALTSTSTFVPPHTVAWLYDSATNETIVYVNPTDHTLSIGDSALVEIHLQGIASIEPSDIVPAPTTAPIVVAGADQS